jgi:4-aminobutyrate aminotransferase-like enzyme
VGTIRGRGLLLGIEFVADKTSKTPFDASLYSRSKFSCAHAVAERLNQENTKTQTKGTAVISVPRLLRCLFA